MKILLDYIIQGINMKILVRESSWSGMEENYQPKEVNKIYEIEKNKKIIVKEEEYSLEKDGKWLYEKREKFSFIIKQFNNDSIIIETNVPMSDSKKGINLFTEKVKFEISILNPLELTTPTMDEGDIFIISLIKDNECLKTSE